MMDDFSPASLWIICYSYPPVIGGSEIEVQRICIALRERGHSVKVLCAGGGPMPAQTEWVDPYGIPVRIIGGRWPERLRGYVYALAVAWQMLLHRRSYQFIYFLMTGLHLATGLPMARMLGKHIIMKFSGSNTILQMKRSWLGRLEVYFLRRWAGKVMILNPSMQQEALDVGLPQELLLWMPNPVDIDSFKAVGAAERLALRQSLGLNRQDQVILFVGRLAPEKELPSLLGAFAQITAEFPDAVLVLVGDGPLRAELQQQAQAAGVASRVRFLGMIHPDQVCPWLQASDIFTLVSSLEGLPCSLLEAMSTGLASLVSGIPAITQLVDHDQEAWVTPVRDEVAIADGLRRLLGDADLRNRLAYAARQRAARQFSTESVVRHYEDLLYDLSKT